MVNVATIYTNIKKDPTASVKKPQISPTISEPNTPKPQKAAARSNFPSKNLSHVPYFFITW